MSRPSSPTTRAAQLRAVTLVLTSAAFASPSLARAQRCEVPRVMLTVDRSSSMLGATSDGVTSKWQAAETAIGELTGAYEARIDFGLQVFPYPDRCQPGEVVLDFGAHAALDVVDALGGPPPSGGNYTPMSQTLDAVREYLGPAAAGTHLVLVTDGWQWCDPYDATTRFNPVAAVERLRRAGVTVHVVGFGAAVDSLTLNRAAVAAGTALAGCDATLSEPAASGHCYAQADDLLELRAALDAIARQVVAELCDGLDNDCDGVVDEGFDADGDGFTTCGTVEAGGLDEGLVDCADDDAEIHPGAAEVCNAVDDDCDGAIDPDCACSEGEVASCGSDVGVCMAGVSVCEGGAWSACRDAVGPSPESCDGTDQDCDGLVDEDARCREGFACMAGECVELVPDEPTTPVEPTPELPPVDDERPDPTQVGACHCAAAGASGPRAPAPALAVVGLGLALAVARRRVR